MKSRMERIIGWLEFSERRMVEAINGHDGHTYSKRAQTKSKATLNQLRKDTAALKKLVR